MGVRGGQFFCVLVASKKKICYLFSRTRYMYNLWSIVNICVCITLYCFLIISSSIPVFCWPRHVLCWSRPRRRSSAHHEVLRRCYPVHRARSERRDARHLRDIRGEAGSTLLSTVSTEQGCRSGSVWIHIHIPSWIWILILNADPNSGREGRIKQKKAEKSKEIGYTLIVIFCHKITIFY